MLNATTQEPPSASSRSRTGKSSRRTQTERRRVARQQILDAAIACFNEGGFHATTTEEVARRAGVSKGLIHYHFRTKHDLILAVELHITERIYASIVETAASLQPSVASARQALDRLWSEVQESQVLLPLVLETVRRATTDPAARQRTAQMVQGHLTLVQAGVEQILGPLRERTKADLGAVADLIFGVIAGLVVITAITGDEPRGRRAYALFKDALIREVLTPANQEVQP